MGAIRKYYCNGLTVLDSDAICDFYCIDLACATWSLLHRKFYVARGSNILLDHKCLEDPRKHKAGIKMEYFFVTNNSYSIDQCSWQIVKSQHNCIVAIAYHNKVAFRFTAQKDLWLKQHI